MKCLTSLLMPTLGLLVGCSKPAENSPASTPPPPLSEAVQQSAIQRGRAIAAETFSLVSSNLQSALASGGVSNALPFCSLAASPLTAGMAAKHGVTLRRIASKARNPGNKADTIESAILAYFESLLASNNLSDPPLSLVTNLVPGQATFFAPIVLNNALCLKCHGEPGRDISAENLAIIQQHYPHDEATGFKLGQLRGAWRIDIPLASLPPAP